MAFKSAKKTEKKSRFGGVKASGDRVPLLPVGQYIVRITSNTVSDDSGAEYFKLMAEVVDVVKCPSGEVNVGDETLAVLLCLSGRAFKPGAARIKSLAIALSGCANEGEYDEMDPDGLFCEHILGEGDGKDASDEPFPDVAGSLLDLTVRRGKEREDGDYFREWNFAAAVEE